MLYFTDYDSFALISDVPEDQIGEDYTSYLCLNSSDFNNPKVREIMNQYAIKGLNNLSEDESKECYCVRDLVRDICSNTNVFIEASLSWEQTPDKVIEEYYYKNPEDFDECSIYDMGNIWYIDFARMYNIYGNIYMHNIGGE